MSLSLSLCVCVCVCVFVCLCLYELYTALSFKYCPAYHTSTGQGTENRHNVVFQDSKSGALKKIALNDVNP